VAEKGCVADFIISTSSFSPLRLSLPLLEVEREWTASNRTPCQSRHKIGNIVVYAHTYKGGDTKRRKDSVFLASFIQGATGKKECKKEAQIMR